MAMLTPGEYNLVKKNVVHERKSMFFVKLTDSAQRALNNYFRAMDKGDVPIIEFNKNEGRLLIPTISSNKNREKSDLLMTQYKFDVKSNVAMQGRQGRFECVQHVRGSKQLIKYGQLTQRLTIQASEDSYGITKERMAAIELQQRKNCTIQLDWNSTTNISRRVKVEKNNVAKSSYPSAAKTDEPKPVPVPVPIPAPAATASNMIRSKSRPTHNPPPQKINPAAYIIRKPLKERIIHLLALRPHKKPELYAALKKDGLRECDRPHLSEMLSSVSTIRDNVHHLSKHAWNDVQEDWLFYTESEKQQIKKSKLQNLTSPSNSNSDSGVSVDSNQSPNNSGAPTNRDKRPGYSFGTDGFQTKRPRISHFVKQEPGKPNATMLEEPPQPAQARLDDRRPKLSAHSAKPKANSHVECEYVSRKEVPVVIVSSPEVTSTCNDQEEEEEEEEGLRFNSARSKHGRPEASANTSPICDYQGDGGAYTPTVSRYKKDAHSYNTPPVSQSFESPRSSHRLESPQRCPLFTHPDTNTWRDKKNPTVKPKYLKEYVPITDIEQRRQYKADFNEIFKEYQRVHEDVDSISNIFAQLGESLKQHKKGSPVYESIEKEIKNRYYSLKRNQKYQAAKRRFDYLHEKLSHIKNLVHEYDQKMLK